MDLELTLVLFVAAVAIAVASGWRGARPPNPHKGPRLLPYRFIMLLAAAVSLFLLIHLASLAGLRP